MLKKLLLLALLLTAFTACSKPPEKELVRETVAKFIPVGFEILQVSEFKGLSGLYEVVIEVNKQPVVLYVDRKAKYVFSGNIMSTEDNGNLTLETQEKYQKK